ncbi:MAG: quinoprotein dehydrogenase-associated putative ABC transporter substrate-binding protein [Roseiarcus sp.]
MKLLAATALFALANASCIPSAQSQEPPLRVCADPNNLPYSDAAGEGFENKIVDLVADYLHRPLAFVWRAERRGFVREGLNAGECDLVAAIPSGASIALTTRPYYRSTYAFVSRPGDPPISSLDDPSLRMRTIGVQLIGDDGMNSPPAHALAERGIVGNVRGFMVYGDYRNDHPLSEIVHAVATGEVDVAAVWGPVAGYFAAKEKPPLVVTAIEGNAEARLPMTFDIAMGVRRTDKELKTEVDSALSSLASQIGSILASYDVPVAWDATADR